MKRWPLTAVIARTGGSFGLDNRRDAIWPCVWESAGCFHSTPMPISAVLGRGARLRRAPRGAPEIPCREPHLKWQVAGGWWCRCQGQHRGGGGQGQGRARRGATIGETSAVLEVHVCKAAGDREPIHFNRHPTLHQVILILNSFA